MTIVQPKRESTPHRATRASRVSVLAIALIALSAISSFGLPDSALAQKVAFSARVGTIGAGPEVSLGTAAVRLRAGYGLLPIKLDAAKHFEIDGVASATLELPKNWYTVGADFSLGGLFRIGGGLLYRPNEVVAEVTLDEGAGIDLGGIKYSYGKAGLKGIKGTQTSRKAMPYAMSSLSVGGASGLGLFLDLGVAFAGEPEASLKSILIPGTDVPQSLLDELESNLKKEEDRFVKEAAKYLKYWPILSVGVRFGLG